MLEQAFILIDEQRKRNCISMIENLDTTGKKKYQINIGPYVKPRTVNQNAALYGVAYPPIMEAMGMRGSKDKDELHEYFCGEYFGWVEYYVLSKKKLRPKRTTTTDEEGKRDLVSTEVMADLYDFVQQRGADHGIWVPDPDPMHGVGG